MTSHSNVNPSDFWNIPPAKAFNNAFTTSRGKTLQIQWPLMSLPSADYYIALYFQDNRTPSPYSWRVFSISVNGKIFYANLNVTTKGTMVYSSSWPLSGKMEIALSPAEGIPVGPVINAGEVLQILPLGGRTLTRDGRESEHSFLFRLSFRRTLLILTCFWCSTAVAMMNLARNFNNPPPDWSGDPCLPENNSWTGVTCSQGKFYRVVAL